MDLAGSFRSAFSRKTVSQEHPGALEVFLLRLPVAQGEWPAAARAQQIGEGARTVSAAEA
jgi:hypothetical protein